MAAVPQYQQAGPYTATPAELILGGQAIEGRAAVNGTGRVGVAGAASTKFLGVAITDGINPEAVVNTPVVTGGRPILNAAALPQRISYVASGTVVPMTFAATATYGEHVVCASNGQVTPAGATPAVGTIIGRCVEPLGVTTAGAVGLVRVN